MTLSSPDFYKYSHEKKKQDTNKEKIKKMTPDAQVTMQKQKQYQKPKTCFL